MKNSIHRVSYLALAVLGTVVCGLLPMRPANADSQQLMSDLFGMYTNTTDPQALESQQRGGMSFGSIYVRNRIVRPNLINFEPPRIRGNGCQGMDLYGGSFSFINADQLVSALRAVAGNALTYAFTLALGGVCPECMQQIEWLRDKIDQVNKIMQDSCTAAQALVNATPLNEMFDREKHKSSQNQALAGVREDINDALTRVESLLQKDQSSGELTPENVVWKAMEKSALGSWFGSYGDTELKTVLMSLTGTMLKTTVNNDGVACTTPAPESAPEYCVSDRHPLIKMATFVEGSSAGNIELYYCADNEINCLDVRKRSVQWMGLKERVQEVLFGAAGGSGGIIAKIRNPGGPGFTPREDAFMTSAPMPIRDMLMRSAHDPGALVSVGRHIQEVVASEMAKNLVLEMVSAVSKSFQSAGNSSQLQMYAQMKEKLKEVVDDVNRTDRQAQDRMDIMLALMQFVDEVKKRDGQKQPAGTSADTPPANRK